MDADSKPIDPIPEKGYPSPSKKGPNFVHGNLSPSDKIAKKLRQSKALWF